MLPLFDPAPNPGFDEARRRLERSEARVVAIDAEYPTLLRESPDPPPVLFVRGRPLGNAPDAAVAIVGSRRPTRAGLEAARALAGGLAREGVDVVSGFARGIDGAAHGQRWRTGRTTAVLGSGIDVIYPSEHGPLSAEVVRSGALVSEFPMGTGPKPHHFPVRNRVIAGVVPLVVVVEAAQRSGSLITARHAADYGRDVAAVPGTILADHAAGSNALLKDGAILVRSVADVLEELRGFVSSRAGGRPSREAVDEDEMPALGADARLVLGVLDPQEPLDADALVAATGLDAARLSAALVLLELDGLAEPLPGATFVRRKGRG